jgi:oligoribonuclease
MSRKEIDLKKVKPTKLLWVDLEMTGLDPKKDVIIEVAAEVTDFNFKTLGSYEAVIKHPKRKMKNMNEWSKIHHAKNGLIDRIDQSGKKEKNVMRELIGFIKGHFGKEPAILAGNSIHNDRIFIQRWWPEVENLLHYRMLDVTALKIVMQGKYKQEYKKKDVHRAFDDIQASIAELQYYLEQLKKKK